MSSAFPLIRIKGIEVRAHWTWIFLLALMSVVFGGGLSTQGVVGFDPLWGWTTGVATAILVFVSVTVHELAHAVVARRSGIGGPVVVVQLLGGSYTMELRPRTAGQELRASAAGPALSLVLAAVFGGCDLILELVWGSAAVVPTLVTAAAFVTEVLAVFNLFVAAVNLLPGYPMDGARIVHAIAWARSGRDDVANVAASRVGRLAGGLMVLGGAGIAVFVDWWPGLALMLAGWLIIGSSRILDRRAFLQALVAGARARDAADAAPQRIPAQLTLDVFAGEYMTARSGGAALVERAGEVLGVIGTAQLRRVSQRKWQETRTEDAMVPLARLPKVAPESDLWPALEALERSGVDAVLVEGPATAATAATPEEPAAPAGDGAEAEAQDTPAPGPALLTRRSAAQWVHERAEERAKLLGAIQLREGTFGRRRPPRPQGSPQDPPPEAPGSSGPPDGPGEE